MSKTLIIILLAAVLIALFTGLGFLFKDNGKRERTLTSLIVRVSLAVALMIFLVVSVKLGWVQLHPL